MSRLSLTSMGQSPYPKTDTWVILRLPQFQGGQILDGQNGHKPKQLLWDTLMPYVKESIVFRQTNTMANVYMTEFHHTADDLYI